MAIVAEDKNFLDASESDSRTAKNKPNHSSKIKTAIYLGSTCTNEYIPITIIAGRVKNKYPDISLNHNNFLSVIKKSKRKVKISSI